MIEHASLFSTDDTPTASSKPLRARVRCEGTMHRIVLTPRGRLVLLDHPDPQADRVFIALGGATPRCLRVLEDWRFAIRARQHGREELPTVFTEALAACQRRALERGERREPPRLTTYSVEVVDTAQRCPPWMRRHILAAYEQALTLLKTQCTYRRQDMRHHHITLQITLKGRSSIRGVGRSFHYSESEGFQDSYLFVTLRPTWCVLARRRLAVIDGCFVIERRAIHPDGSILVVVGRQGEGFTITPALALVRDGHLRWC